jgi:hypothetical protein
LKADARAHRRHRRRPQPVYIDGKLVGAVSYRSFSERSRDYLSPKIDAATLDTPRRRWHRALIRCR